MVTHLIESMRMANGDVRLPSRKVPLRFTPLKQLIIYCLPFPKGVPTAPALLARVPAEWSDDVSVLHLLIDQFAMRDRNAKDWPEHPAFGRLSARAWGVLAYRHIDHHFRQFGV
jgi:hypothetical protein